MTLFERVFGGNDAVYGLTEGAIDAAIAQHGEEKAVSFPNTAYALPCYYAVTGTKVTNLKELKEALGVVKTLMTRENKLNDVFMSGVATALCAEFIEAIKYIDGAQPYEEPCYGHLSDAVIRELGVPLGNRRYPGRCGNSRLRSDRTGRCGSCQELSGTGYSGNSGRRNH